MKFFLDTASLKDISWATQAGVIDGITAFGGLSAAKAHAAELWRRADPEKDDIKVYDMAGEVLWSPQK